MARFSTRRLLLAVTSLVAAIAAAGGVAVASSGHHLRRELPLARVIRQQGTSGASRVIVILKNQYSALTPSTAHIRARRSALASAQAPLQASVRRSGGTIHYSYSVLNAFAATASRAEVAKLKASASVAEVLPDAIVHEPSQGTALSSGAAGGPVYNDRPTLKRAKHLSLKAYDKARAADGAQQVCPANPADPIIAPEGLGLINAPQAQALGITGAGVKVGFVADGIDVNNPDFIRPDGQHVIADYQDFSGDGTTTQSGGAEAFGDASTIAAQGQVSYDLSQFSATANPLPAGCDIKIEGVAPGATLYAMKVFGSVGNAFTSTIIQGMNWAVAEDHVNVLNESFGGDDLPDTTQDVTKLFNRLATAAGVVVVASSGDQGTANTIGSPASDSAVGGGEISVGATTQFQGLAQTTRGAYQLGQGGWLNDNIANFSSGGFTQFGTTLDLVAPGNESFEPCTANPDVFGDCVNLNGTPSNISTFGGTSESSPFTAGVAALMIQAYSQTHNGQTPSPSLVRNIILSNTTDLTIPSTEQGAGELNALADVQAAMSVNTRKPTGSGRLISPNQLDFAQQPGTGETATVRVTNVGASSETYTPSLRTLGAKLSDIKADINVTPATDPTFTDWKGVPQGYQKVTFTVPAGAQRLDAAIAHPGDGTQLNMTLFDPEGRLAAYTYQSAGEPSNFGHIDVRVPQAGTWTAVIFTPVTGDYSFSGTAHYEISTSQFAPAGLVSPSSLQLAPGQTGLVHVSLQTPQAPGDYSRDLVIGDSSGNTSVVPIVSRSLVPLRGGSGNFAGSFTGGNGDGFPADEETFAFDVPRGAPIVHLQLNLPTGSEPVVFGFLTSPEGQTLAGSVIPQPSGPQLIGVTKVNPEAGRWTFTAVVENPVGGTAVSVPFSGSVSLQPFPIKVSGVPDSSRTRIPAGGSTSGSVTVTNSGNTDLQLFLDPRLDQRQLYSLTPITQATGVALPVSLDAPPEFLVPTQTNLLLASAQGSAPLTVDWGFGDPDLLMVSHGNNATGVFAQSEVANGIWSITPALTGPIAPDGETGTVDTGLAGRTRVFDTSVTSPPGDPLVQYVDPNADPGAPIDLPAGQTTTIPVTFAASGKRGSVVSGDLFVDDYQFNTAQSNELGDVPYRYRVGR
jgi:Subtilase family/Peptidase inhibitor I9